MSPGDGGSSGPAAGQQGQGHWINRWQTIVVAGITALGAVVAAAVGLLSGNDKSDPPPAPPSSVVTPSTTPVPAPSPRPEPVARIQSIQYQLLADGTRVIRVSGVIDGLTAPAAGGSIIPDYRAMAEPLAPASSDTAGAAPAVRGTPEGLNAPESRGASGFVYISTSLDVKIDGTWQVDIAISPEEKRNLDVYMGIRLAAVAAAYPPSLTSLTRRPTPHDDGVIGTAPESVDQGTRPPITTRTGQTTTPTTTQATPTTAGVAVQTDSTDRVNAVSEKTRVELPE